MHKCINKSIGNVYHLEQLVGDFFPYSQQKLGFDKPVDVVFQSDAENSGKILGKTAYYDPSNSTIVLYVDGRHPKDIMRSLSHELVHHAQNCRGDFKVDSATPEGYAQKDPHLRKMEREAYTKGNLIFRDYEDLIKTGKKEVDIDLSKSGEPKMSLKEWKNDEINQKLMKKWGLLKENKELEEGWEHPKSAAGARSASKAGDWGRGDVANKASGRWLKEADDDELEEGHEHGAECGCPDQELEEAGMPYRKDDDWGKSPAAFTGTEKEEKRDASHLKKGKGLEEAGDIPKISVREAKEITRRIIERIKKESR